jgi:hypothetical protein
VWANTVLNYGLTDTLDLQLGIQPRLESRLHEEDHHHLTHGFGDLFLRAKAVAYADDKRGVRLSFIPYLKIPTNTGDVGNGHVEAGLIVPFETQLPAGFNLGVSTQVDVLHFEGKDGFQAHYTGTAYVVRPVHGPLSTYGEVIAVDPQRDDSEWYVGGGLVFTASDSVSLDFEYIAGANDRAADHTHTLRVNWSF